MTTMADLAQEITDIIQDDEVTANVIDVINAGIKDAAGRVLIPELEVVADLATTAAVNFVALPNDFQRHLGRWAYNTGTNLRIAVYPSVVQLFRQVSKLDLAGNVFGIARQGRNLFYQRVPAVAQTLKIQYFKMPDTYTSDEEPDCLPAHLHSDLLVNYACWKYWTKLEDGEDGKKPNTAMHKALYDEAAAALQAFIGPYSDLPTEPVDELNYQALMDV